MARWCGSIRPGPLIVQPAAATDLAVDAAIAGVGIICLFEDWLRPHLDSGALEPVLEPWWQSFSGPFLYYPGRRLVPAPLRAFVDFIKASADPKRTSRVRERSCGLDLYSRIVEASPLRKISSIICRHECADRLPSDTGGQPGALLGRNNAWSDCVGNMQRQDHLTALVPDSYFARAPSARELASVGCISSGGVSEGRPPAPEQTRRDTFVGRRRHK